MLQDTQQVLFRSCGFKRDDHVCQEPTLNVFENATCVYHITLPVQPHNNFAKVCFVHYILFECTFYMYFRNSFRHIWLQLMTLLITFKTLVLTFCCLRVKKY